MELLLTLQRLVEHFVSAAMSIQQSRPFDGVCIIVTGAFAALADALIRKIAVDEPSEACSHLMGRTLSGRQLGHPGFGLSVGSFATQVRGQSVALLFVSNPFRRVRPLNCIQQSCALPELPFLTIFKAQLSDDFIKSSLGRKVSYICICVFTCDNVSMCFRVCLEARKKPY